MTREKKSNIKPSKGTVIEGRLLASPDDIQRLREMIETGQLARIPVTHKDGTVGHIEIDAIELSPLSPESTERVSWRRREDKRDAPGDDEVARPKSR